jgi:hypothetical protein
MKTWLTELFGDANGVPDDARISAFIMVLTYCITTAYNVAIEHHNFDMQSFGIGAGALAAGVGVWFGQRGGA